MIKQILLAMKLQYRNSEQTKTNIQESVSNSKSPEVLTNIDNIVCYKSRREELNRRVKRAPSS